MTTTPSKVAPPKRPTATVELVAAVSFFVAMVLFAATLVQLRLGTAPPGPVDPMAGTVLMPSEAMEGVTVTPGRGRTLLVESAPSGASVRLDGAEVGQTPYSSDLQCGRDTAIELEVVHAGYKTARFSLACADGSTRVLATLKRAR